MPKTWEDLKSFDEILSEKEVEIIEEMKTSKRKCPYLRLEGKSFYYCGVGLPENFDKKSIEPTNPVYTRHMSITELSAHCFSKFETCCYYRGNLKFHDLI